MSKFWNWLIFTSVPPLIVVLSVYNAQLVADQYLGKELGLAQYNAIISSEIESINAEPQQEIIFVVSIRNEGNMTWLPDNDNGIFLSYHILTRDDESILSEGGRTPLPGVVRPGEEVDVLLLFKAPIDSGFYLLEIDMVHENVTWFKKAGSVALLIELTVV